LSSGFEVYFAYDAVGYVGMEDWDDLDVDELWATYVEGTKEQSKQYGYQVRSLRWLIKPTLNRVNSVAYYAIEAQFGEAPPLVTWSSMTLVVTAMKR
jgi:uncharacterized membrane-anchored protein